MITDLQSHKIQGQRIESEQSDALLQSSRLHLVPLEQWLDWARQARWEVAEFQRLSGVGRTVFYREFAGVLGSSPRSWLRSERMRLAARLLLERRNVSEAAADLGYDTPQAFSVAFSRFYGYPPKEHALRAQPATGIPVNRLLQT